MARLLLTGAGGFIGSHVLRHVLTETEWDVVATDSFRHKGKTDRILLSLDGDPDWLCRLTVITHDLAAPISPQMAERIGPVDYLIAMASASHVDRSITDPAGFARNNVELALSTLEYARQAKPRAVIWISTDEVYGPLPADGKPHREWAPILPSNPYAASKAAQEALAISYWRTYGVPLIITNTMNLIGEMQDAEKFLPMLISRISRSDEVTIHGSPRDIGSRHYLHARNLADALLFLLTQPRTIAGAWSGTEPAPYPHVSRPERYNIAGLERLSNLDLAGRVAKLIGRPLRYRLEDFHTTRPGHDPHYGLDGDKIASVGWKPPVPFDESLARTVAWTLSHQEWLLP